MEKLTRDTQTAFMVVDYGGYLRLLVTLWAHKSTHDTDEGKAADDRQTDFRKLTVRWVT